MNRRYLEAISPDWRTNHKIPVILLTALARIRPNDDDGSFLFHPEGQPAVITPVFGPEESTSPRLTVTAGALTDLVAWHPAHDWAYAYCGSATLGCVGVGQPIVAHRSVLEWFRAECEGIVVLRW